MLIGIEKILLKERPYCVIVQGDTNTALAGALTAEKISTTQSYTGLHIRVAHVEAGLRSFERSMPEETNRFIADHLSDFLFVPTLQQKMLLLKEGLTGQNIYITGNTIVDAVCQYISLAQRKSKVLKKLALESNGYILLTLHRQENVDSKDVFSNIISGLSKVIEKTKLPITFPIHPRTVKMARRFNLKMPQEMTIIEPAGFLDFLWLEANARLVLSDSGGVQEEACILKVPCVTLRNNTERPETVDVGANIIAGTTTLSILKAVDKMLKVRRNWKNPFGDGRTAERMLEILLK
jgi:UDP-N-acetylglucosamine 2-epimerase (non-hydrolysing)